MDRAVQRYVLTLLVIGIPMTGALAWFAHQSHGAPALWGVLVGSFISLVNGILGFAFISWGLRRSTNALLLAVVGGFMGRLFVTMLAIILFVQLTSMNPYALGLSVVGFYFLSMGVELYMIRDRLFPPKTGVGLVAGSGEIPSDENQ